MRDLLSKLDAIFSETALNPKDPKGDYHAKTKALQDLQTDPEASKDPEIKKAIIQRKADLEKEAGEKGVKEDTDIYQIGDDFGISVSEDFEIGTEIADIFEDGVLISLDETAVKYLEQCGFTFEEVPLGEEKQKGVDGKVCWKGYRRMGTKMKGGKRVDNCVKVKEDVDKTNHLQMAKHHEIIAKEMNRIEKEADDEDDELYSGAAFEGEQFHQKAAQLHRNAHKTKSAKDSREANDYTRRTIDHGETHHFTIKGKGGAGDYGHDFSILHKHFTALQKALGGDDEVDEAEYQGRKVPLGKPMAGDVKKSKVYVKNPQGNVVKVNFGDKKMRIKKSNPNRRKSFRARHNCANPGPRHKARYWSCRAW